MRVWAAALAVVVTVGWSAAEAQTLPFRPAPSQRPSHVPLPGDPVTPATADEVLRERLLRAEMTGDLQKLAGDILKDPEKYRIQAEQLRGLLRGQPDLRQPGLRQAVERILEQQAAQEQDPEKAARWKEALRRLEEAAGPTAGAESEGSASRGGRTEGKPTPPGGDGEGSRPAASGGSRSDTAGAGLPAERQPIGRGTGSGRLGSERPRDESAAGVSPETLRQLQELAGRLKGTPLEDSRAMQQMLSALDRVPQASSGGRFDWSGPRKVLEDRLKSLQGRGGWGGNWPRVDLPSLGGWQWPEAGLGSGGRSVVGPGPISAGPGEDWEVLALVVGGAGAVFLAWAAWRWYTRRRVASASSRAVADWPVPLGALRCRADVIAAFEHLALARLGPPARAAHHHAIAEDLGRDSNAAALAAERLAEIYEQARYEPEEGSLPEEVLAEARKQLGRLAEGRV